MARMVGLSRQRFHQLLQAGVFPQPQRNEASGRPFYDEPSRSAAWKCVGGNCGVNGQVVLFYARRQSAPTKPRKATPAPSAHGDLLDGLRSLGLTSATAADVTAAVKGLYPRGSAGIDRAKSCGLCSCTCSRYRADNAE